VLHEVSPLAGVAAGALSIWVPDRLHAHEMAPGEDLICVK
jgi:hypothetical protein